MTLSLNPCFRVFVFPSPFFLLFSLESYLVLKSFNGVSRKFQGCLKFQGCFEEVLRVFTGNFRGVSRKFQKCLKEVSRVFQGSFKSVSRKFQGCFKNVSRVFQVKIEGIQEV